MTVERTGNLTLAVTGASGAVFAGSMLRLLAADPRVRRVDVVVSDSAMRVLAEELGLQGGRSRVLHTLIATAGEAVALEKFRLHDNADIGAGIASGSYPSDGMVVLPCSMATLAAISHGMAQKLVGRAADVCLKEKRPLVLCVRETPFHLIHLRNMATAAEAGATIFPVIPAFYNKPDSTAEMAAQFCCRVLQHIGLPQPSAYRWKDDTGPTSGAEQP